MDLNRQVLEAIKARPGRKAAEIAKELGVERGAVNQLLYGGLKGKVRQGKNYGWYPHDGASRTSTEAQEPRRSNTALARLCRYYLECMSHDNLDGVSEFAASSFGDLKYTEIGSLPMLSGDDP